VRHPIPRAASKSLSLCSVRPLRTVPARTRDAARACRCGARRTCQRGTAGFAHALGPFHHLDGAISYCLAIVLQLSPDAIALSSFEDGFAMHAGRLSSMQLPPNPRKPLRALHSPILQFVMTIQMI
jgi:hypothetical protein